MAYRGITILTPPLERLGPRLSTCSTAAARNLRRRVGVSLHPRTGCRQASCGMPTASLRSGLSSSVEGEPRPCPAPWERRSISHICHGQQPPGAARAILRICLFWLQESHLHTRMDAGPGEEDVRGLDIMSQSSGRVPGPPVALQAWRHEGKLPA